MRNTNQFSIYAYKFRAFTYKNNAVNVPKIFVLLSGRKYFIDNSLNLIVDRLFNFITSLLHFLFFKQNYCKKYYKKKYYKNTKNLLQKR